MAHIRVLVDADACPVRAEIEEISMSLGTKALFFANSSQLIQGAEDVADRPDGADFVIAVECREGDVVVTDDIGLAALVLSKNARALSSRGLQFEKKGISRLLEMRHEARKLRRAGKRTKGPARYVTADRARFKTALAALIMKSIRPSMERSE